MKKILSLALAVIMLLLLVSCGNIGIDTDTSSNRDTSSDTDTESRNNSDSGKTTDTDTSTDTPADSDDKKKDPAENRVNNDIKVINIVDTSAFDFEDIFGNEGKGQSFAGVTDVDVSKSVSAGNSYKITSGGFYRFTGKSDNGQIYVRAQGADVVLIFDNLELSYNGEEPTVYAEKCKSVTIVLVNENRISDSANNLKKGAIYVKSCGLTMDGDGTLYVNGNFKSGIFNTKELVINGGKYIVNAKYHGIYGEQKLTVNGGKFNITSGKSGLKSGDFDEMSPATAVTGAVVVNSGSITVNATTNGISSYGMVEINNGRIYLNALSDGIDATQDVTINGGTVIVKSVNGINTDGNAVIGGSSNFKADTSGDGIDAANVIVSTSGVVYIKTQTEYVADAFGDYILYNGSYYRVNPDDYPENQKYSPSCSCKGIKATYKIDIKSGVVGIDSFEDALKADTIEIGAKTVISTNENAADAVTSVTITGGILQVLDAYKGIKAPSVSVNGGETKIATVSDSIDSANIKINGGVLYLFEKPDCGTGTLEISGGTVFAIFASKTPIEPTATSQKYISVKVNSTESYTVGNYIRILGSGVDLTLKLPKNYSKKACVFVSSSDMADGSYKIESGVFSDEVFESLSEQSVISK